LLDAGVQRLDVAGAVAGLAGVDGQRGRRRPAADADGSAGADLVAGAEVGIGRAPALR
jgi:hypothetical protein